MTRGFLKVNDELDTKLPERQTKSSAGYDFYVIEDVTIPPHQMVMLPTNVKAYMQDDEVLMLYARSSLAIKRGLTLQNVTGIIDSDFFPLEIKIALKNNTDQPVTLLKNERCAQGIFMKYLVSDNGNLDNTRDGGFGSTGM
jgi:dUTP pyrophosphatase